MAISNLRIRQVTGHDLERCTAIEAACYGPEGATRERIEKRIAQYPQGFLVAELRGRLVGFVNSGCTYKDDITDEEFKDLVGHDPSGRNIVIFSLAVHPDFQKRGISSDLMQRFIQRSQELGKKCILLLCKPDLIDYYRKFGFMHRGQSKSTHGGLQWHEMALPLTIIVPTDLPA
jgi:ribosomal protein S18 acetylase RimI-like enzyme